MNTQTSEQWVQHSPKAAGQAEKLRIVKLLYILIYIFLSHIHVNYIF